MIVGVIVDVGAAVEQGRVERRWAAAQLVEMEPGEPAQHTRAGCSQAQTHHPMVTRVGSSFDEVGSLGPVDQPDHAVVPEQQVLGDVPDRRGAGRVPPDREEELVLRRCDAGRDRLLLAPVQEAAELVAKRQQARVVGVGERSRHISQYDISDEP